MPRDKVTVLTKTFSRDPAAARADLDRFRHELGVDYLDVCLMHCVTEADWTERYRHIWEARFDRLDRYLQQMKTKETKRHGGGQRKK